MPIANWMRFFFVLFLPFPCFAAPYYGLHFSYAAIGKEPENLKALQLMLSYDPDRFKWRAFNVYFDGGISHFWVNGASENRNLSIISLAPVVRYTFRQYWQLIPYLELSIGIAYLNHTRLDNRNLGIHFSFQDRAGIGTWLGALKRWSVGIHAVHYSNAHLSSQNSGITAPLVLDISYRF